MGATIDHLRAGLVITVLQPFRDLAGALHPAGESGRLRNIELNWGTWHAEFLLEAPGGSVLRYALDIRAKEGPANGRMRAYFSAEEVPEPPAVRKPPATPPGPVSGPHGPRVDLIVAHAARKDWPQAQAAFDALMCWPEVFTRHLTIIAEDLEYCAAPYATPESADTFEWLYEKAVECMYRWAGQATSGGEGTAMMHDVKKVERRRTELRRFLGSA